MWVKLRDFEEPFLREGALFKFKSHATVDSGPLYALAIRRELKEELSFFSLDGRGWGYGRSILPPASKFEGRPYTLDVQWIRENFMAIAEPDDPDDIWLIKDARKFMLQIDPHQMEAGDP